MYQKVQKKVESRDSMQLDWAAGGWQICTTQRFPNVHEGNLNH